MLEVQRVSAHSAPLLRVCLPGLGVKSLAVSGQGWLIEKTSCEERDGRCLSKGPHSFPSELLLSWVSCPYPHWATLQLCHNHAHPQLWALLIQTLILICWLDSITWSFCFVSMILSRDLNSQPKPSTVTTPSLVTSLRYCGAWPLLSWPLCPPAASSCLVSHWLFLMARLDLAAPWQGDSWQQAYYFSSSLSIIPCNAYLKKGEAFERWKGLSCRIRNSHAKTLSILDNFPLCNCARNKVLSSLITHPPR